MEATDAVSRVEPGYLIKFGSTDHMETFREQGLLYMNNLPYFWGIEDEGVRGDAYDSAIHMQHGTHAKIFEPDTHREIPVTVTGWTFRVPPPGAELINLFCMYAVRPSTFPVPDRVLSFGDAAVLITDPNEFMSRIKTRFEALKINGGGDLVRYIPDDHRGGVNPFEKRQRYAWQAEWRLRTNDGPNGPKTVELGGLTDISYLLPAADINTWLRENAPWLERPVLAPTGPDSIAQGASPG